jgi:hypothetical protein
MPKERKYILIAGVIALIAGGVYRFSPDAGQWFPSKEELLLKEKKVAKYREMIDRKESLMAALNTASKTLERVEARLLTGETPAISAVEIQKIINEIASRNQVEIKSMQVLEAKAPKEGIYMPIPVEVTLTAGIRQIKQVLYEIENAQKLLKISKIKIRASNARDADMVQSTFTVEGLIKTTAKTE